MIAYSIISLAVIVCLIFVIKALSDLVTAINGQTKKLDSTIDNLFECVLNSAKSSNQLTTSVLKMLKKLENKESKKTPPVNDDGFFDLSDDADFDADVEIVRDKLCPFPMEKVKTVGSLWMSLRSPQLNPEVLAANWLLCETKKEKKEALKHLKYVKSVYEVAEVEYPSTFDFDMTCNGSIHSEIISAINLEKSNKDADEETYG